MLAGCATLLARKQLQRVSLKGVGGNGNSAMTKLRELGKNDNAA
jgi:hypothetical protein